MRPGELNELAQMGYVSLQQEVLLVSNITYSFVIHQRVRVGKSR